MESESFVLEFKLVDFLLFVGYQTTLIFIFIFILVFERLYLPLFLILLVLQLSFQLIELFRKLLLFYFQIIFLFFQQLHLPPQSSILILKFFTIFLLLLEFVLYLQILFFKFFHFDFGGFTISIRHQCSILNLQLFCDFRNFSFQGFSLIFAFGLQDRVFFTPFICLASLLLHSFVQIFYLLHIFLVELFLFLDTLLIQSFQLLNQMFIFTYQEIFFRSYFSYLNYFPINLIIKFFYFFFVSKLKLIDDLQSYHIIVTNQQYRTQSFQFLVFERYHILDITDLLLVLVCNCGDFGTFICDFCFQPQIISLFNPECLFDIINNLICALQLFEGILVCKFFTVDLFLQKLYLIDRLFVAMGQ